MVWCGNRPGFPGHNREEKTVYVLFVSRLSKVFVVRRADGPEAYDPPEDVYDDVSVVDDSIEGWLDTCAVITRIAREEGWRSFDICVEKTKTVR